MCYLKITDHRKGRTKSTRSRIIDLMRGPSVKHAERRVKATVACPAPGVPILRAASNKDPVAEEKHIHLVRNAMRVAPLMARTAACRDVIAHSPRPPPCQELRISDNLIRTSPPLAHELRLDRSPQTARQTSLTYNSPPNTPPITLGYQDRITSNGGRSTTSS